MTLTDGLLFWVVGLVGAHQLVTRLPTWPGPAPLFWFMQLANLATVGMLLTIGLPTFTGNLRIFNFVFAALLTFHTVSNNNAWGTERRRRKKEAGQTEDEQKAAILAALDAGENKANAGGREENEP